RQASCLHEISYRACFKPQLPRFFIELLTKEGDVVYDPFAGRGTTIIEAALLNRKVVSNDINPISEILSKARLAAPVFADVKKRLEEIPFDRNLKADIDLSMFYHKDTLSEILSLKKYLKDRQDGGNEDDLDRWIRMIATNRLTGHSKGFFSVYSMPPNQAVSQERQIKINEKLNHVPQYRNVKELILKKTETLIKDLSASDIAALKNASRDAKFLQSDAGYTPYICDNSVNLVVTSPPFLDIVQYAQDNWLRLWFNSIPKNETAAKITMSKNLNDWRKVMSKVFDELYRVIKYGGFVAFEVGEIKNGKIKLDEEILPIGIAAGFSCKAVIINKQEFTKTANIWGVKNNSKGTNTNRIVLFQK
ncbi:MAG: DNA adenine methylase, partial [Endomicrobium sp.]|nr:DNA adenine methylase [Endomicrobium sp.]